jgi:hypothetical protein
VEDSSIDQLIVSLFHSSFLNPLLQNSTISYEIHLNHFFVFMA